MNFLEKSSTKKSESPVSRTILKGDIMSETKENLKNAFAGESQANRKYLAFAKKADEEGKIELAKLFRAAASGETIHAMNHLKTLEGIKSPEENIKEAIDGESYEINEMYPKFIEKAKEENNFEAVKVFKWALEVEKIHNNLFKEVLEKLKNNESLNGKKYFYVCKQCGYPSKGKVPEICPVCGFKEFMAIE